MTEAPREKFYDLGRLFALREALDDLRPDGPPKAVCVAPADRGSVKRAGILSGSFNPPTIAHLELARRAKESFSLDRIFFTLSPVTVDKERIEGLMLEDRLLLLELLADELGWAGVAIVNRGLYFEQAQAFRSMLGKSARISVVAGMDKLIQIFDPRYYQDREASLRTLLTEAQLLVAMRANLGMNDLEQILNRPENQAYRDRVFAFALPPDMTEISSSSLRHAVAEAQGLTGRVPKLVAQFITEAKAYRDSYELRAKLLDRLYGIRESAEGGVDFLKLAEAANGEGSALRKFLLSPHMTNEEFKQLIFVLK
jgi:nicotinamide-nucleotide adenylyltransferase